MKRKLISFIMLALATVSLYAIPAKPGIWKTLKLAMVKQSKYSFGAMSL